MSSTESLNILSASLFHMMVSNMGMRLGLVRMFFVMKVSMTVMSMVSMMAMTFIGKKGENKEDKKKQNVSKGNQ